MSTKPKTETLLLWAWCLFWPVQEAIHAYEGTEVSGLAVYTANIGLLIAVVSWVFADAQHRGIRLYHDFDLFIVVCWPVTMACYLFSSRGVRALLTLLCFAGMSLASFATYYAVWWILYACLA